jgi:hypothetical protein
MLAADRVGRFDAMDPAEMIQQPTGQLRLADHQGASGRENYAHGRSP